MKKIGKKWHRAVAMVLAMVFVFESVFLDAGCQWAKASVEQVNQSVNEPAPSHTITAEDRTISSVVSLTEDLEVGNLTITSGKLDLNGHNLIVQGSINHTGGILYANGGRITCYGDYKMSGDASYSMTSQDDYLCIYGDFRFLGEKVRATINAGIMEIKGDFYQDTQKDSVKSTSGRFYTFGTSTVIFSGTTKQTVHINSQYSYFQKVVLKNKSEEGIYVDTIFPVIHLERNSTKVTCGVDGEVGYTLQGDVEYDGDFILLGGTLNLNGYTLTVNGDLIQAAGMVQVNGGTLKVNGDYRLQSKMKEDSYCPGGICPGSGTDCLGFGSSRQYAGNYLDSGRGKISGTGNQFLRL